MSRKSSISLDTVLEQRVAKRKEQQRWAHIKRTYGISQAEYEEILEEQHGCCAICKRHHTEFDRNLAVDHDHQTLEVRGLLCQWCNQRLLGRHRDPDLFRAAAEYLEKPRKGWLVPKKKRTRKRRKKMNGKNSSCNT